MSRSALVTNSKVNAMGASRLDFRHRIPTLAFLALLALAAATFILSFPASVQAQNPPQNVPTWTVTFGGDTISDKTYTAGARVNQVFDSAAADQGLPKLPEVTVTFRVAEGTTGYYTVSYAATGLPSGLSMTRDRVIRGVPGEATTVAASVTYTATVTFYTSNGSSFSEAGTETASLTFEVTVKPAVTFGDEARKFIDSRIIVWVSGQGWHDSEADGKITFPAATGGTGAITYSLIDNDSGRPLADVASGITFDTATRKLGGTPAAAAQKTWAVTYAAVDQNGGRASGSSTIYAGGWGVGGL